MNGEISLKDLLDTTFTINEEDEMVGSFTLKRINMIGDILTQQYEEIEKLQNIIYEAKLILANKDTFKDYEYVIDDLEKVLNNI